MQRYISNKFNKKILCILILFVMIYTMFGFIPMLTNKSYATTYTYSSSSNNLPKNFDTTYPGYKSLLQTLAKAHPKWTFKLYETGLEWETVINNEYVGHGGSPKNLSPYNYPKGWICTICNEKPYDNGSWRCTSRNAIEYMIDPRNSINESDVFQFQELSYSSSKTTSAEKSAIQKMVKGTFINSDACVNAILEAAVKHKVSPYHIVARIIQEQGTKGSTLGLGIKSEGKTYYNVFNIGATGNTSEKIIDNGLARAKKEKWTSLAASIIGGTEFLAKNFISLGQNTLYFQKFNVVNKNDLYGNQYMQNVLAAQNEGTSIRSDYKDYGILEGPFTFIIPLYKNMPSKACAKPSNTSVKETGEQAYINANGGLKLKDAPNGNTIVIVPKNTKVLITKRATKKINSYYWDRVSTPYGTGYMAREADDGSKTYLVPIKQYKISGSNIIVAPGATIKTISGAKNQSKTFGTGAKITFEGKTYALVILGDVSGDGKISAMDYVKVKNKIMGSNNMNSAAKKAADANGDGKISAADYVKIKNQIMNASKITL